MVAVMATNEALGYAYRSDLEDANGTTASKTSKSPADALAWQESIKGKTLVVPVCNSTGKTVIGEFVISAGGGTSGMAGEPAAECIGSSGDIGPPRGMALPRFVVSRDGKSSKTRTFQLMLSIRFRLVSGQAGV